MRFLKVGGAALNQTPLDWRGNLARILEAIALARADGVQVLCLPELCISGYGCEDAFHGESVAAQAWDSLREILPATGGLAVAVGLPLIHQQQLFNAAALLVDGRLAGLAAKRVLAGYGVYYEPRWFKPWPEAVVTTYRDDGREVPLGDVAFDLGGVLVGFEICEDAWGRGEHAPRRLAAQPDVLLNPSASHFAFDKYPTLRGIVAEGSRTAHAAYVYANLVGNEAGRLIFDGATLIAANGKLLAENPRFGYRPVQLTSAVVDLHALRLERRRVNYPGAGGGERTAQTLAVPFAAAEAPERDVAAARRAGAAYDPFARSTAGEGAASRVSPGGAPPRFEEFARAVSLGLWDYLRKSRSRGFAVSLSGGVDSSSVAVLVWGMARQALAELGPGGVAQALAHLPELPALLAGNGTAPAAQGTVGRGADAPALDEAPDQIMARRLVARLLLTVYQGTENSSDVTRMAARGLAEQLGARHLELEVGPLVAAYERLAETALGRALEWGRDDVARQNIQARVRSPGIWLLTNLEGRLLLSTSNRSEVGVGYATMDGDTSGGLAPIAGANKTFLRAWLAHVERHGIAGLPALPALGAVNRQAPTAELRPPADGQTDEADLMPYAVLDVVEQAAIRDRMPPVEVWRLLLATPLPGIALDGRSAAGYVEKFFRLWGRSQWKRERIAPSFHLDDENLDPRTWCRFPILSGGYETELATLRQAAGLA
ncbi:MAG: NAD(+) synthase [Candidatus Lambdaproteobacteria bacterium]|nr:NAD(+) synthase [Candidatus Lambdaproteobacteria bacterium]